MGLAQQCARPMVVHNEIIEKELEAVEGTQYVTRESILRRAQEIKGIPLRNVDKTGRLATGKGAIGTVIEESWFGYTPNSESEPDFPEAGVELKVTPYLRGKNGIRAKERLVCNIINYMEEYDKTFQTSAFWHKCNTMLLMSYEHLADRPKGDFRIDEAVLFSFPEEDLAIIEHDWETIMEKVREGRAHELSEGDTLYLAACTKGANASSVRQQPFSELPAKQRAYSLKSSYMTQILNKYIFGNAESPRIIKSADVLHAKTFEEYIIDKVKPYYGMTQYELKAHFGVDSKAKSLNEILLARMLDVKGRIAYTEEFQKAGIVPKTIRVQSNGKIKESMSFPTFDFIELSQEDVWEESELYRSSEASGPANQREEFKVGFFACYDRVWELVNLRNDKQHYQEGFFVFDIATFNERVVREAILNAVSHRNYQFGGSIFVRQFRDRLVVESPGGLPFGITLDNILDRQLPRNRRIAEILSLCGMVERSGQGMNLMFELSVQEAKPLPDFTGTDDFFVSVTLNGLILDKAMLSVINRISERGAELLSTEDFLVIDALYHERPLSEKMQSRLNRLIEMGIVEHIGRKKYVLARSLYAATGKTGVHTRHVGLDRDTNKELLLKHIRQNNEVGTPFKELQQVLPGLNRNQIQDLMKELKKDGKVFCEGKTSAARWFAIN